MTIIPRPLGRQSLKTASVWADLYIMMGIEMNRIETAMPSFVMDMTVMICSTSIGDGVVEAVIMP